MERRNLIVEHRGVLSHDGAHFGFLFLAMYRLAALVFTVSMEQWIACWEMAFLFASFFRN